MARRASSNAELGVYNVEGWGRLSVGNEVVRDNSVAHSGSWSWCVGGDGIGKNSYMSIAGAAAGTWFITRCYVRYSGFPAAEQLAYPQMRGSSSGPISYMMEPSGRLQAATGGPLIDSRQSAPYVPGQWHKLELAGITTPGDSLYHSCIGRLDGVEFMKTVAGRIDGPLNRPIFTGADAAFDVRINVDDILINDDSGGVDDYWPDSVRPPSRASLGFVAPTVRSGWTTFNESTGVPNHVISAPGSISAGDYLVAAIRSSGTTAVTPPTGWSVLYEVPGTSLHHVFGKIATASEPTSYTFTTTSSYTLAGVIYSAAGVDRNDPVLDAWSSFTPVNTSYTALPPVDLTDSECRIIGFATLTDAAATWTEPYALLTENTFNSKTGSLAMCGGTGAIGKGGLFLDQVRASASNNQQTSSVVVLRPVPPSQPRSVAVV